jgi:hypothetical protein
MSKRSTRGESLFNAAHKRQAAAPQDEEGPLPSASASLAQQPSSSSIPKMPLHLTADLILPFVADRASWNSVCSASNELRRPGKKMAPPWPNKSFNLLGHSAVRHVAFSPSGLQLAFCVNNHNTGQFVVHVWDPWGKETFLGVTPCACIAWNVRWMGNIWRQEAEMDRFESGMQNRFIALLQIRTAKEAHGHQNKPTKLF